MPNGGRGGTPANGSGPSGFHGQIKDASLSDLVQMECLAGSRGVVRVTSGGQLGYLFFRAGAVVHATAGALVGEPAALEMLTWKQGAFQPVDREWPSQETISCKWQSLLLRAAQKQDEKRADSGVGVRREALSTTQAGQPNMDSVEFEVTPIEVAGHTLRSEDFQLLLRLNATGAIVANHGATEDFADIVAYASRLSELVGMLLGVERFVAMECSFKSSRCFIVLEENGEVVALGPKPSIDLKSIREVLGV